MSVKRFDSPTGNRVVAEWIVRNRKVVGCSVVHAHVGAIRIARKLHPTRNMYTFRKDGKRVVVVDYPDHQVMYIETPV